jgi:hypothetical protein
MIDSIACMACMACFFAGCWADHCQWQITLPLRGSTAPAPAGLEPNDRVPGVPTVVAISRLRRMTQTGDRCLLPLMTSVDRQATIAQ